MLPTVTAGARIAPGTSRAPTTAARVTASSAVDRAYGAPLTQSALCLTSGVGVVRGMVVVVISCAFRFISRRLVGRYLVPMLDRDSARRRTPLMSPVSMYAWRGS
jgi:hypothetical protein